MKSALSGVAALAAIALVSIPLSAASAQDTGLHTASNPSLEFSAQKKKKAKVVVSDPYARYRAQGIAPSFGFIGPPGYPGEYAWRKSIGQCVIDLGYGRFESCDSGGIR